MNKDKIVKGIKKTNHLLSFRAKRGIHYTQIIRSSLNKVCLFALLRLMLGKLAG